MKQTLCFILELWMLASCPLTGKSDDLSTLVKLEAASCAAISADEVERILGLEVQSIAAGHPDVTPRPILLTVTCAPGSLSIVARDSTTLRTSSRIRTDTSPIEGMERIVAIAAAELALSTWEQPAERIDRDPPVEERENELRTNRPSAEKTDAKMITSASGISKSMPRDGFTAALQISALWRLYLNRKTNLFGGEIGGNLYLMRLLRLHLGIIPEGGQIGRALGTVSLFSMSGVFSFGIYDKLFNAPLEWGVDIGFRGGYGRLKGRPQSPPSGGTTLAGGFGGPFLHLSLASVTRPAVGLSVEVGYAAFGLTGWVDIGSPVAIKGPWISLALDGIFFRK